MNQKKIWSGIWKKREEEGVNSFAKICLIQAKEKKFSELLDLGCGMGADSIYFAQNKLNVTSFDFSEAGLSHLKSNLKQLNLKNVDVTQGDILNLDFKGKSFELIYSHLSLHYFNDLETDKIFDQISKLLTKGGLFFIKCKSIDDPLYGLGTPIEKDMYSLHGHIRHFFSETYMREKLSSFKILECKKTKSTYHGKESHFIEVVATIPAQS